MPPWVSVILPLHSPTSDQYAKIGLAQVQLLMRTEHLDGQKIMSEAASAPENLELQMQCADLEIMAGHLEPGFKRLLALITIMSGEDQKRAKERLIELFALVDPSDPRVIKARSALASALF